MNAIKLDALSLPGFSGDAGLGTVAQRIACNADHVYRTAGDLVRQLRPPALEELGLVAALEACVDRWQHSHPALQVQLSVGSDLDELGESLNLSIYRIVQEAMTNCVRHAEAGNFYIDLTKEPGSGGRVLLEMRDDGKGFDVRSVAGRGSGLTGIRERVELLRGKFEMLSFASKGTTIRVEIPPSGVKS